MAVIAAYPSPVKDLTTMKEWEDHISRLQWSGFDGTPGGNAARASLDAANRRIVTQPGAALIRGLYRATDTAEATNVPAASASDRIDRLVWRYDRTETDDEDAVIQPVILQGTPGASTPPDIVQTEDGYFDIKVCRWTSAASGALTGLVDERMFLSTKGPVPCFSHSRPGLGIGTMIYEVDTGITRISDGSGWRIVAEDTGSTSLNATGYWRTSSGFTNSGRRLNGWVRIRIALERTTNTLSTSDSDGSPLLATLPANLRPGIVEYGEVGLSGGRAGNVLVHTDGSVTLYSITSSVPVGATLRGTIVYPGA